MRIWTVPNDPDLYVRVDDDSIDADPILYATIRHLAETGAVVPLTPTGPSVKATADPDAADAFAATVIEAFRMMTRRHPVYTGDPPVSTAEGSAPQDPSIVY